MKNFIVLFLLLIILSSCNAQALHIYWTAGEGADKDTIETYIVYVWQGDSLAWQNFRITDFDSVGTVSHVYGNPDYRYKFPFTFDEQKIIRGGVKAQDYLTRRSDFGLTPFYFWPDYPRQMWIAK